MKTQLLGLPIIKGESHHLQAFVKDCEKFGYYLHSGANLNYKELALSGNSQELVFTREDHFKCLYHGHVYTGDDITLPIKTFNLPQDWSKALEFMEENMKLWNKIQEENKIVEYKEDDWVIGFVGGTKYIGQYVKQYPGSDTHEMKNWQIFPVSTDMHNGGAFEKIERFATEEEIQNAILKVGNFVTILEKPDRWASSCKGVEYPLGEKFKYPFTGKILEIKNEKTLEREWLALNISGYGFSSDFDGNFKARLATKEEIESLSKPKVFTMTASNGNFELEVSKKGIYYKPEDKWLHIENVKNMLDNCKGTINSYEYEVKYIKIGCKVNCLLDEWQNVFNYYISIIE